MSARFLIVAAALAFSLDGCSPTTDTPDANDVADAATIVDAGTPDAGESCLDAGGCFSCPPTVTREFLNACTGTDCSPFDNATRLGGLLPDGGLPPLP